jgi:uncharacterized protein YicC (UPF0701 family)
MSRFAGETDHNTIDLADGAKLLAEISNHYCMTDLKQILEDAIIECNIPEYKEHTDLIEEAILAVCAVARKHQPEYRSTEGAKSALPTHPLVGTVMSLNVMQSVAAMLTIAMQVRASFERADTQFPEWRHDRVQDAMRKLSILNDHKTIAEYCHMLASNTHIATSTFGHVWAKNGKVS